MWHYGLEPVGNGAWFLLGVADSFTGFFCFADRKLLCRLALPVAAYIYEQKELPYWNGFPTKESSVEHRN